MKRTASFLLAAVLLGSGASAESLTVAHNGGSSGEAMHDAFYAPFSEKTGIEVVEDTFAQELAKVRSQFETGNLIWDVVNVTAINEATGCDEGLFEPIDWSEYYDPADFEAVGGFGECGIPNLAVAGGLAYDGDVYTGDNVPRTWADFWDVEKFPGKRGMLYRAEQTLEVALMADGVQPSEATNVLASEGGVERAFAKLEELKPHIQWWKSGDESMQLLLSGEVAMTFAWNGRVSAANSSNNRNLKIEYGGGYISGSQYFVVMAGTQKMDNAIDLVRFASDPEPQAAYTKIIDYAPANAQAYKHLPEDVVATLPNVPLELTSFQSGRPYLEFWLNNGDTLLQRFLTFAAK